MPRTVPLLTLQSSVQRPSTTFPSCFTSVPGLVNDSRELGRLLGRLARFKWILVILDMLGSVFWLLRLPRSHVPRADFRS